MIKRKHLLLFSFILILIVFSGLRFSDGSFLLAIAEGKGIGSPIFTDPNTHYIFDSPLKYLLLSVLPSKIVFIASCFLVISLMPLLFVWSPKTDGTKIAYAIIVFSLGLKICLQNVGVGDGIIIGIIGLLFLAKEKWQYFALFILLGLWHPQQSFFVFFSYFISQWVVFEKLDKKNLAVSSVAIFLAFVILLMYKEFVIGLSAGREGYLLSHLSFFLERNVPVIPLVVLPFSLLFLLFKLNISKRYILLFGWVLVCLTVAVLTYDFSRVFNLIVFPLTLAIVLKCFDPEKFNFSSLKNLVLILIIIATPLYSWSGIDIFLWSDLFNDMEKWLP